MRNLPGFNIFPIYFFQDSPFELCDLFMRLWKRSATPESHKAVTGPDFFLKQNKPGPLLTINHFEQSVHPHHTRFKKKKKKKVLLKLAEALLECFQARCTKTCWTHKPLHGAYVRKAPCMPLLFKAAILIK